jgi:hypothetical protein
MIVSRIGEGLNATTTEVNVVEEAGFTLSE